jgi:hypothetical protein
MLDRIKLWLIKRFWGDWPMADYLTIVDGAIHGPVRWENKQGQEKFITSGSPDGWTYLRSQGPVTDEFGVTWEVSIIQKKSMQGHLDTQPRCSYTWDMEKLQEFETYDYYGTPRIKWKSGSEKGRLWRSPFGWRRDLAGTELYGERRYWIPTLGHWGEKYD